jgi:PKD repeat protein
VINTPVEDVTVVEGESVSFSSTGSDPNGHYPLTYVWDFAGGAPASTEEDPGPVQFDTAGTYEVTLTVTDTEGLADPTPHARTVTVEEPATPFDIHKMRGKLNFRKLSKDRLTVVGELPLEDAFDPPGKRLSIDVGGVTADFTLDAKGKARTLAGKVKVKPVRGGLWKLKIVLKRGDFARHWEDEGLTNTTVKDAVVTMKCLITLDEMRFVNETLWFYNAKAGKRGRLE